MSYWGARLIRVCDMTHSYWGARLIRVCDMTHSCVWHDSLIRGTWLIYVTFMFYEGHIHNKTCLFCISYHGETWFEWYTRPPHTPLSSILHTHIYERIHEHIQGQDFMMVIWVSHIPHIDESCHTHEWVYIMSESYTTYRWVMSHTWMSLYHIMGHDSFVCVTWRIDMWYMTHSYDLHVLWGAHPPENPSLIYIILWGMTHLWLGHDSFVCGTWLIHMTFLHDERHIHLKARRMHEWSWDMTLQYEGHDSFICGTWLI